jgi:hypothetical protein
MSHGMEISCGGILGPFINSLSHNMILLCDLGIVHRFDLVNPSKNAKGSSNYSAFDFSKHVTIDDK